jgi:hypothetical protein
VAPEVVRNKSRILAQGYSRKEGIDYEETFAPVAHLEAIRILLSFSVAKGFKLHQMDVKSAFLNGVLEEVVYVRQPPGFESEKYPHQVYKLRKVLYGLKHAPRAWYGRLRGFLFERGFEMGKVDQTLFLLRQGKYILIVQVYVDDIVFGGSSNSLVTRFAEDMSREFEMSMMGELQFPRATNQGIKGRNIYAPSQVHQGHCEEVQDGGLQGLGDAYEYDYNS